MIIQMSNMSHPIPNVAWWPLLRHDSLSSGKDRGAFQALAINWFVYPAATSLPWTAFGAVPFTLVNVDTSSHSDEAAASAASTLVSAASAGLAVASCASSSPSSGAFKGSFKQLASAFVGTERKLIGNGIPRVTESFMLEEWGFRIEILSVQLLCKG